MSNGYAREATEKLYQTAIFQDVLASISTHVKMQSPRGNSRTFQKPKRILLYECSNGDSGYPLKPYLITPLLQANTEGKRSFNGSLIRTRNIVERAYGATKAFPCISLNIN
nr:unnamed protein product [Callosobruchus analis]